MASPLATGAVSAVPAPVEFNEAVAVAAAPSSRHSRSHHLVAVGGWIRILHPGADRRTTAPRLDCRACADCHRRAVASAHERNRPRARHPLTGAIARELSSIPARDLGLRPAQGHHPSRRAHLVRRSHCRRAETRTGAHPPRRLAHPDRRRAAARDLLVQPADLDRLRPPSRRERACLRRRSLDERYRSAHLRHASC